MLEASSCGMRDNHIRISFDKTGISREELTSMMAGGEKLEALSHEQAEFARTDENVANLDK